MKRRIHRENRTEHQQTDDNRDRQRGGWRRRDPDQRGQQGRHDDQRKVPVAGLCERFALGPACGPQYLRGPALHGPIKDRPHRHKAADHKESFPLAFDAAIGEHGVEIDRDAHDKPHIARPEEEQPRGAQPVDIAVFGQDFGELGVLAPHGQARGHTDDDADQDHKQDRGHHQRRRHKPQHRQHPRTQQKASALDRVLRSGQQCDPAEQAAPRGGGQQLDRGFRAHLGQILGHARQPLHQHDKDDRGGDAPCRIKLCQRQQRDHLQRQPRIKRRGQPEARRDPARRQVGDHARDLVEHEQIGQLHRREAERVKMQQHQHPQRAIGQHKGPIGGGDSDIGGKTGRACHSLPPTISATSTRRCA